MSYNANCKFKYFLLSVRMESYKMLYEITFLDLISLKPTICKLILENLVLIVPSGYFFK